MDCWVCKKELIWGGDDDWDGEGDQVGIVSNLKCPECDAFVLVYHAMEMHSQEEDMACKKNGCCKKEKKAQFDEAVLVSVLTEFVEEWRCDTHGRAAQDPDMHLVFKKACRVLGVPER